MVIRRIARASVLGLACFFGQAALAAEPASLPATNVNQAIADTVAAQLRQSSLLRGYRINITTLGGQVELTGSVTDTIQRDEALRLARAVTGVVRVSDRLQVTHPTLVRVQGEMQGEGRMPTIEGPDETSPSPLPPPDGEIGGNGTGGGGIPEPSPIFRAPVPAYYGLNPPPVPPHAWPTYAPYNNYSRVACPTAYPYNAWPFIGPMYPFPKVPLGWRSVKLQWDDGYWWYGRVGHRHDWWRLRFW